MKAKMFALALFLSMGFSESFAQGTSVTNWSIATAHTLMTRYPDPDNYPYAPWSYPQGYLLIGISKLWQSTGDKKYYDYIMRFVDEHVDEEGNVKGFKGESMDDMMAGSTIVWAYAQTGKEKYRKAAERIRDSFSDYPRTLDSLFWHKRKTKGEVWVDGVFMGEMFLTKYGKFVGDSEYCFNEAARQIVLIWKHLRKGESGLLYHAFDEDKDAPWADQKTGLSPEVWSEGLGWYALMLVEALEVLPTNHPRRLEIVKITKCLTKGLKNNQDPQSGLWYQVVDKGNLPDNWTDASGSGMFLYAMKRASELGVIDSREYGPTVEKGYKGLLTKAKVNSENLVDIHDCCDGVCVQRSYEDYVGYKKSLNAKEAVVSFLWGTWIIEKPRSGFSH